jgi:cytochrome d ubiquinol oxidase subunit II
MDVLWFIVIAVLWVGFFVLEGFDFGVGMLHTIVGRTETGKRFALNTIDTVGGLPHLASEPHDMAR